MMDDLKQLLVKADSPAPPIQADLASSVRKIVICRRTRRRAVASVAAAILVSGVVIAIVAHSDRQTLGPMAVQPMDVKAFRREIADLDARASLHARIGRDIETALARNDKLQSARRTLAHPDPVTQLREARQVAAELMLTHAKQMEVDPKQVEDAAASYRKLAALFPDTVAGREASHRLEAPGV